MKKISYQILSFLTRRFGLWFFRVFSWVVATGYFFLFPSRVANSIRFYRALFPGHGFFYAVACAWKQYHRFTDVYVHRFLPLADEEIEYVNEGLELLDEAVRHKTGAVLLMSHIGNWELAARTLHRKGFPIMLYLGTKRKVWLEQIYQQKLVGEGVRLVTTPEDGTSPFALIEGAAFLREGGLVSMAGDRLWGNQRSVTVDFLGHKVRLPETPYRLALSTDVPLVTFFIHQEKIGKYHVQVALLQRFNTQSEEERKRAVQASAQAYADALAQFVRNHPFEWYHFEPFLGPPVQREH